MPAWLASALCPAVSLERPEASHSAGRRVSALTLLDLAAPLSQMDSPERSRRCLTFPVAMTTHTPSSLLGSLIFCFLGPDSLTTREACVLQLFHILSPAPLVTLMSGNNRRSGRYLFLRTLVWKAAYLGHFRELIPYNLGSRVLSMWYIYPITCLIEKHLNYTRFYCQMP